MVYLFPHTTVPPLAAETLLGLFEELTVLQPTRDASISASEKNEATRQLKTQCPFETGHEQVNQIVSDYLKWAEQHSGTDLQQMKSQLDTPLFFDEESSFQLESLIRPSEGHAELKDNFDVNQELLSSRLFLSLAQTFDTRSWEIEANLDQVDASEARLFAQLHGNQSQINDQAKWGNDLHGSYMVRERMAAWSFFLTQLDVTPSVFVTLYPEIKVLIEETVAANDFFVTEGWAVVSDDTSGQARWRERFSLALDRWLLGPSKEQDLSELLLEKEPPGQNGIHITICRIRQCNPMKWLGGLEQMWNHMETTNSIIVSVQ